MTPRVLVTGAAGRVARRLEPLLSRELELRLTDLTDRPPGLPDVPPLEESTPIIARDLGELHALPELLDGIDAVVHLAGAPSPLTPWSVASRVNVDLTESLLAACVDAGVQTLVYGSSIHAVGAYVREGRVPVQAGWAASPCCAYGASKAAAEVLGGLYAATTPLQVISLRIGMPLSEPDPARPFSLRAWVSVPDLADLVLRSIRTPASGIYHAVSPNTRSAWAIDDARTALGWAPHADAEAHADRMDPDAPSEPVCFTRAVHPPSSTRSA